MDIVKPINPMLTDEHVLAIDPKPVPDGGEADRRRINPFQGRALSADALAGLQRARMVHQSLLQRAVTPGIVDGLEVQMERGEQLVVFAGSGLAASGDTITVGNAQRFRTNELAVLVPSTTEARPSIQTFTALKTNTDAVHTHAAVLIAIPVSFASNDSKTPHSEIFVPRDPIDDAFAGLSETDACLFALYPFPSDTARSFEPKSPSFRNNLTQSIFAKERNFAKPDRHPWELQGLPLALIGFNADWTVQFIDHASVRRAGGQRSNTMFVPGTGNPALWQAQITQFGEQLGSLSALPQTHASLRDVFPKLPPVGFLPKRLAGFATENSFFPASFNLRATPIPADQVATILSECKSMASIDLAGGEDIELAFPVPVADYDPLLMWPAKIAADFDIATNLFLEQRDEWLKRRAQALAGRETLVRAQTGASDVRPAFTTAEDDETIATFASRRLTNLQNGVPIAFKAPGSQLTLRQEDSLYIWAFYGADVSAVELKLAGQVDNKQTIGMTWSRDMQSSTRHFSALPKHGQWQRLVATRTLFRRDTSDNSDDKTVSLETISISELALLITGGGALIAEVGVRDATGNEKPLLQDALIETLQPELLTTKYQSWPWTGPLEKTNEEAIGTVLQGDQRQVPLIDAFTAKLSGLSFLGTEAQRLSSLPLSQLIDVLNAQINATNDAVDLGFLMARTNTFRVREFMLGSDAASRLMTSPALADIVKQDSGARVTGEQLQVFLDKSNFAKVLQP